MLRRIFCILLCALLIPLQALAVSNNPYPGYTYDAWGRSVPAPSGYNYLKVIYPQDTQAGEIKGAKDLFVCDNELYVVDTGNNRVIVLNEAYDFVREYKNFTLPDGKSTALKEPTGIFVRDGRMLIADTGNARVLDCDMNGNVSMSLERPVTEFISAKLAFRPIKVCRDASGFVYVLAEGVFQGLLCYDSNGIFTGFYGSNKVTADLAVIVGQLWKQILSEEQAQSMERFVPIEIANHYLDSDDFIFTVTSGSTDAWQRGVGKVQRLNPLGTNVLRYNERDIQASGGALYEKNIYGDVEYDYIKNRLVDSILIDVHADENGIFSVLDRERGRVFQYDLESNLLFIFGGIGSQKGTFGIPSALEKFGENYIVLDEKKNNLTVFAPTEYARNMIKATELYNQGLYAEAEPYWRKVLQVNAGNAMAYRSIGKYYLEIKDYDKAMEYLELGQDRDAYSMAFTQWRKIFLQENFIWLLPAAIAAFFLLRLALRWILKKLGFERKKIRIVFH